jgi:hypothetical protein
MHRQQRITIDLAVQILRSTLDKTSEGRVDTVPVRLALRCLWSHCPERWPLVMFWEGAQQENEIGRSQSVTASFNGIVRQLRRSARIPSERRDRKLRFVKKEISPVREGQQSVPIARTQSLKAQVREEF